MPSASALALMNRVKAGGEAEGGGEAGAEAGAEAEGQMPSLQGVNLRDQRVNIARYHHPLEIRLALLRSPARSQLGRSFPRLPKMRLADAFRCSVPPMHGPQLHV